MKNLYSILGISHEAPLAEVKKVYHSLALKYHPDRNKSENATKKFREINAAYSILADLNKRRKYDIELEKIKVDYQKTQKKAQRPKQQTRNEIDDILSTFDAIGETIKTGFRYAKKISDMFGGF